MRSASSRGPRDENRILAHHVRGEEAARIEIPNAAPKTMTS
jgi:hypothetical protein